MHTAAFSKVIGTETNPRSKDGTIVGEPIGCSVGSSNGITVGREYGFTHILITRKGWHSGECQCSGSAQRGGFDVDIGERNIERP